jgi:hypothetical protein
MALHEIDSDLRTAESTLTHWATRYPALAKAAVESRIRYDLAWADAIRSITDEAAQKGEKLPTLPVQDALATQKVAKQMTEARQAEADLDVAKKLIAIAETTLSSIQTRAKLSSMEMSLAR